eukprot:TRINITY_DN19497_c0_g1_i2.p1 TRINITY_DN19497_c0_g1~~TRINITY_DN19497_c0_g1_i2.p1  ORF type:complete len:576 (-),score=97.96 TRINITY_DN19497_c0_g1_i2:143-1870(-)
MSGIRQASDLLPNPNGCSHFDPQLWRRERCRSCGHSWKHHRGAIAEPILHSFTQARAKSSQATAKAEAIHRETARAKAEARRRANQTEVDDWFLDGAGNDVSESEDEGFRMMDVQVRGSGPMSPSSCNTTNTGSPLRVVNFIDFGECNMVSTSVSTSSSPGAPRSHVHSIPPSPVGAHAWGSSSRSRGDASSPSASGGSSPVGVGGSVTAGSGIAATDVANTATTRSGAGSGGGGNSGSSGAAAVSAQKVAVGDPPDTGQSSSSNSSFCPLASAFVQTSTSLPSSPADSIAAALSSPSRAAGAAPAVSARCTNEKASAPAAKSEGVDALLQEVDFLRHLLADSNEEKKIHVAIVRDEMSEVQRANDDLKRRLAVAEASCHNGSDLFRDDREAAHKAQLQTIEVQRRQAESAAKALGERCRRAEAVTKAADDRCRQAQKAAQTLRGSLAARESDLAWASHRLMRLAAPAEALESVTTDDELEQWEKELLEHVGGALKRIAQRRIGLKVKTTTTAAALAQELGICKICFDQPSSCALLPCRHHAFCIPCAQRVRRCREPACPICRTTVTGMIETFSA